MKNLVEFVSTNDWTDLYFNGKFVAGNHSLGDNDYYPILEALGCTIKDDVFFEDSEEDAYFDDRAERMKEGIFQKEEG